MVSLYCRGLKPLPPKLLLGLISHKAGALDLLPSWPLPPVQCF